MAVNRIGNGAGKGPVIGRDGLADTKSFSIDETIAYGKDVAGNEDDPVFILGQELDELAVVEAGDVDVVFELGNGGGELLRFIGDCEVSAARERRIDIHKIGALFLQIAHSLPSLLFGTIEVARAEVDLRERVDGARRVGVATDLEPETKCVLQERDRLVWVTEPDEARRVAALDDTALADEIERRSHSILGRISVEGSRGQFPLSIETVRHCGAHRLHHAGRSRAR